MSYRMAGAGAPKGQSFGGGGLRHPFHERTACFMFPGNERENEELIGRKNILRLILTANTIVAV